MTDKLFNKIRFGVELLIPGIGTAYYGLALIWGWMYAEEVVASAVVLATFGGIFLQTRRAAFNNDPENFDGMMLVKEEGEKATMRIELNEPPAEMIEGKELFKLKIKKEQ